MKEYESKLRDAENQKARIRARYIGIDPDELDVIPALRRCLYEPAGKESPDWAYCSAFNQNDYGSAKGYWTSCLYDSVFVRTIPSTGSWRNKALASQHPDAVQYALGRTDYGENNLSGGGIIDGWKDRFYRILRGGV